MGKAFLENKKKKVWLSNKKTPEERWPAKVIHRAYELICQHIQPSTRGEKISYGKQIKVDGRVVAFTCKGALQWSSASHALIAEAERDQIKAFAED